MSKYTVVYSDQAKQHLRNIYQYIAFSLFVPDIASKQTKRIMDAVDSLDEMPLRNPSYDREPWQSRGVRKLIVDNYIAFYRAIDERQHVLIIAILYVGQNIEKTLPRDV